MRVATDLLAPAAPAIPYARSLIALERTDWEQIVRAVSLLFRISRLPAFERLVDAGAGGRHEAQRMESRCDTGRQPERVDRLEVGGRGRRIRVDRERGRRGAQRVELLLDELRRGQDEDRHGEPRASGARA